MVRISGRRSRTQASAASSARVAASSNSRWRGEVAGAAGLVERGDGDDEPQEEAAAVGLVRRPPDGRSPVLAGVDADHDVLACRRGAHEGFLLPHGAASSPGSPGRYGRLPDR
ncbi:hypothetical protein ABMX48_14030 [Streptomyces cavourensis]